MAPVAEVDDRGSEAVVPRRRQVELLEDRIELGLDRDVDVGVGRRPGDERAGDAADDPGVEAREDLADPAEAEAVDRGREFVAGSHGSVACCVRR